MRTRLMPNIGRPKASKRRIQASITQSIIRYGAHVSRPALEKAKSRQRIIFVDRKIVIRVCCAYRAISTDAFSVISDMPPIDLLALERHETCALALLYASWQHR